ncbi:Isoaspartyl peptidase/L-asparaginase [Microtus ochrogaster]|uniref:Isoaspartyl peptidase/L-asparaginase n=1 Tax=Microtus ochrogaster TaxID=79684 RepID=A0A8J6GC11_MICOH|nr:Isoaspartyl peptidase/L-asparaginase [Microtus ochrogaster]
MITIAWAQTAPGKEHQSHISDYQRRGTVACGAVAVAQQFAVWWLGRPDILATAPHRESVPCARGSMAASARGSIDVSLVVVVHGGGASNISADRKERVREGIARAATEGYKILKAGGSAVDAVEGAVTVLENDPEFNAGCGSVLNVKGDVEMDASIMDGRDLSAGAVSAVRCIANPTKLARLVMEKTPHCFLTGHGAEKFAADMGIPETPVEKLITERSKKHLEKEKLEKGAQKADCPKNSGTVGAVALDCKGNLAYATSTGGIVNKMVGRVGDSPCIDSHPFLCHQLLGVAVGLVEVVGDRCSGVFTSNKHIGFPWITFQGHVGKESGAGAGGYADNNVGAVSTTGHGESILKVNLARLALFHVEQGKTVDEAAELALNYMKSKLKGLGGLILVSKTGDWVAKWTSATMPWAAVKNGKLQAGIDLCDTKTMTMDLC